MKENISRRARKGMKRHAHALSFSLHYVKIKNHIVNKYSVRLKSIKTKGKR